MVPGRTYITDNKAQSMLQVQHGTCPKWKDCTTDSAMNVRAAPLSSTLQCQSHLHVPFTSFSLLHECPFMAAQVALSWSNKVLANSEISLKDTLVNSRLPRSGVYGWSKRVNIFVMSHCRLLPRSAVSAAQGGRLTRAPIIKKTQLFTKTLFGHVIWNRAINSYRCRFFPCCGEKLWTVSSIVETQKAFSDANQKMLFETLEFEMLEMLLKCLKKKVTKW